MDDGIAVGMGIEEGIDPFVLDAVESAQPAPQRFLGAVLDGAIEFGAVAGREDDPLENAGAPGQVTQRTRDDVRSEGQSLTDVDRGGLVVESEDKQLHIEFVSL